LPRLYPHSLPTRRSSDLENWTDVIREFYGPFEEAVQNAHKDIEEIEIEDEVTEEVCEVCGRNMVIKWGRYGQFLACPGFPECRKDRKSTRLNSSHVTNSY